MNGCPWAVRNVPSLLPSCRQEGPRVAESQWFSGRFGRLMPRRPAPSRAPAAGGGAGCPPSPPRPLFAGSPVSALLLIWPGVQTLYQKAFRAVRHRTPVLGAGNKSASRTAEDSILGASFTPRPAARAAERRAPAPPWTPGLRAFRPPSPPPASGPPPGHRELLPQAFEECPLRYLNGETQVLQALDKSECQLSSHTKMSFVYLLLTDLVFLTFSNLTAMAGHFTE